jgi:UDP-N-acetylglucosamine--N-acetylmuramyl-(pentapeptide) pyrophosphoryl-undecaprenol N-acetylglucosamine transferase
MRILLCGGGTGGHITPILAIAHEIKKLSPDTEISYIGEYNSKFVDLVDNNPYIDRIFKVHAGKLRRYHKQAWADRFLDYKTNVLNIRDLFLVGIGFLESVYRLIRYRPDIILLKGGYVGLPVGAAASILRIPFITHDSDAKASLTNSLVGRWALYNATGSHPKFYRYKEHKIVQIGVPVSDQYVPVNQKTKDYFRKILKIPIKSKMILIIGGSLGATEINKAFVSIYQSILNRYKDDVYIVHQVGRGKLSAYDNYVINHQMQVKEFFNNLYQYSAAADVVITRASATALAELAIQGKPVIAIPNPNLTGGHQLINGEEILNNHAGIVISEPRLVHKPELLLKAIFDLLDNQKLSKELSDNISKIAISDAAIQTAKLLLKLE